MNLRRSVINRRKRKSSQSLKKRYVKPEIFKRNFETFAGQKVPVIAVKILPVGSKYEQLNPSAQASFDAYNTILERTSQIFSETFFTITIDETEVDDMTLEDGFHLNLAGHRLLSERIAAISKFHLNQP